MSSQTALILGALILAVVLAAIALARSQGSRSLGGGDERAAAAEAQAQLEHGAHAALALAGVAPTGRSNGPSHELEIRVRNVGGGIASRVILESVWLGDGDLPAAGEWGPVPPGGEITLHPWVAVPIFDPRLLTEVMVTVTVVDGLGERQEKLTYQ